MWNRWKNQKLSEKDPVQVYVGCAPQHEFIVKVLEYSVGVHTRCQYKVHRLFEHEIEYPRPKDPKNWPGTPFSFQRFMIPEVTGFKGRAIYMDADQILLSDIGDLFFMDMKGSHVMYANFTKRGPKDRAQQSSVMLQDCSKLTWKVQDIVKDLDEGKYNYRQLMTDVILTSKQSQFSEHWNELDKYSWMKSRLLHYTKKNSQPWINNNHPVGHIWFKYLFGAMDAGVVADQEVQDAIDSRIVRPSMRYQIDNRILHLDKLPKAVKDQDKEFIEMCLKYNGNSVPGEYQPSEAKR